MRVMLLCMLIAVVFAIEAASNVMMRQEPEMVEITIKVPKEISEEVISIIEGAGYEVEVIEGEENKKKYKATQSARKK